MALMFLEAIVDVGKAQDAVTVAKLKSHSKVGYQDHPMGEASCSTCSMFTPAEKSPDGEPACSLVKRPISPHGWCEDYDSHDRSDDVRERLASMLGIKVGDELSDVAKDGPPDEARDERGRWTTGTAGPAAVAVVAEGRGSSRSGLSQSALSNIRGVLRDAAYGPKAVADAARRVQAWYESQATTPKGYHWENGTLVEDSRNAGSDAKQVAAAEQKVADLQRQLSEHSQDKSEDLYWGVHRMLQQARDDLANLKSRIPTQKAFNPDEPRDEIGRWTSGDGGPDHPDFMHGSEGDALAGAMGDVAQGMRDSVSAIEDAHSNLEAASSVANDHSDEEDDALEQGSEQNPKDPSDSAVYRQWEKTNNVNMADVADKTMTLRNAVADHLQATAGVLSQLDARIQKHADENGKRA